MIGSLSAPGADRQAHTKASTVTLECLEASPGEGLVGLLCLDHQARLAIPQQPGGRSQRAAKAVPLPLLLGLRGVPVLWRPELLSPEMSSACQVAGHRQEATPGMGGSIFKCLPEIVQ